MNARNALAVLVGGVVAFVWSSISWMLIPWHQPTMSIFKNEDAFAQSIREAALEPGIYTYPGWTDDDEAMQRKHDAGPYLFASVVPSGVGSEMAGMMLGGLIINVGGAACLLLLMGNGLRGDRLRSGMVAAVFVSAIPALMNWNWWHFPVGFTAVGVLDGVIGWGLAVLAMSWIAKSTPASSE